MAIDLIIDVPFISKQAYTEAEKTFNTPFIKDIKTNYGTIISNVSKLVGVPENLIVAFIWVESGGKNTVPSTGIEAATGLMQIAPATIYDTLNHELKTNGLSEEEKTIIKKYLPTVDLSGTSLKDNYAILKYSLILAAKIPEFNILMGAQYLAWLIDEEDYYESYEAEEKKAGIITVKEAKKAAGAMYKHKVRLDRVVVRYNAGYYIFKKYGDAYVKSLYALSVDEFYKKLSSWSSGAGITKYIRMVGGINGILDILISK